MAKSTINRILKLFYFSIKYRRALDVDFSCNIGFPSSFEGANKIHKGACFRGSLGYGSYVGPFCDIAANVGRFTSIAPYVRTNDGTHPYTYPFVTTCPMFYSTRKQNGQTFANEMKYEEIRVIPQIGSDCWICENVFISGGVCIGDGSVILSGSVVTSDIPPYAIAGGVPAKVIKFRYDDDTISFLLEDKWWDKDLNWLSANWELLCDIERYKSYVSD